MEYKFQIGCQLDMAMGPDITRQLLLLETILRLMPHSITGEDAEDVLRLIPTDIMGDATLFPLVNIDPSAMNTAAVAAPANAMGGIFLPFFKKFVEKLFLVRTSKIYKLTFFH
jgi:hypothetical protein